MKGSKNIVADALSCLDKNETKNETITPNQSSLRKYHTLDNEDIFQSIDLKFIVRNQPKDNLKIKKVKEKSDNYSVKQFHRGR